MVREKYSDKARNKTKAELEYMFARVKKLDLPWYVVEELQEQAVFFSQNRIVAMSYWTESQFMEWYKET